MMSYKSHLRMLCLFLTVMVILACGLFPSSETQPTPAPPTATPDITSTPEGSVINSRGGYTLYIPNGYYSNCNDGYCVVGKNNPDFGGMMFYLAPISTSEMPVLNDHAVGLLLGLTLEKIKGTGFDVEHDKEISQINIGNKDWQGIDLTGNFVDTGGQKSSLEGQIIGFSPSAEQFFWALAWANTTADPDIWENQERVVLHFILSSVTFESKPAVALIATPTSPPPTNTPEPSVVINLGPGRFGKSLWLEVVKGSYQITSGATFKAGSAIDVDEDWMTFPRGLVIHVKDGEITLKGKTYPAGTTLYVDSQGNLTER